MESIVYALRPSKDEIEPFPLLGNALRLVISSKLMSDQGFSRSQTVLMRNEDSGSAGIVILWPSTDGQRNPVLKAHSFLREVYSFGLKNRYTLSKYTGQYLDIEKITLTEVSGDAPGSPEVNERVRCALLDQDVLEIGGCVEILPRNHGQKSRRRRFRIDTISPPRSAQNLIKLPYQFSFGSTTVEIRHASGPPEHSTAQELTPALPTLNFEGFFGNDAPFAQIKGFVLDHASNSNSSQQQLPIHLFISGSSGTGKSRVLKELVKTSGLRVFDLSAMVLSSTRPKLEESLARMISEARGLPTFWLIDDLDLVQQASIAICLQNYIEEAELVGIRLIAVAKNYFTVHEKFRLLTFEKVDLPTPGPETRLKYLENRSDLDKGSLLNVAQRTHAFNFPDLNSLVAAAKVEALKRTGERSAQVVEQDFQHALGKVHPSIVGEAVATFPKVTFADIGGYDHIKEQLQNKIVAVYRERLVSNVRAARGILFSGSPGCAKTMFAEALAHESQLVFLAVKAPELLSKYVGQTEANIRNLFYKASQAAPAMIFIDEIDAIAPDRGRQGEQLQSVATFLTEMDGVKTLQNVLVVGATNAEHVLDPAIKRPGRIDMHFRIGPPDLEGRKQVFGIHIGAFKVDDAVDMEDLAARTEGWTGAEIAEMCRSAMLDAELEHARKGIPLVLTKDSLFQSFEKVQELKKH